MHSFFGRRSLTTRAFILLGVGLFGLTQLAGATVPRAAPDTPPVAGVVKDSSGAPIANAQVIVTALNRVTTTTRPAHSRFAVAGWHIPSVGDAHRVRAGSCRHRGPRNR
jgi:hypothetical protein